MLLMKKKPSNPVVKKQYIALPDIEHFDIEQQSTIDTCGLCAAEMVMNTILNQKKVTEDDIIKSQITPNIPLFKKTVGIFPSQLQFGIQEVIDQYALPYTATLRHLLSYREIKNILKQ